MTIRKKFITDVVEKYKKDYPQEYKDFLKYVEFRRSNADDKKFARLEGQTEIRVGAVLPDGIMNVLEYALKNPGMFDEKVELKWFLKKYPEFSISRSY